MWMILFKLSFPETVEFVKEWEYKFGHIHFLTVVDWKQTYPMVTVGFKMKQTHLQWKIYILLDIKSVSDIQPDRADYQLVKDIYKRGIFTAIVKNQTLNQSYAN